VYLTTAKTELQSCLLLIHYQYCTRTQWFLSLLYYMVPTIFWYWNSRTPKLHFQGPILDGSLQHGQY